MSCAQVLSYVRLFETLWTVAQQTPLSMDFSGKNTGVGCHFLILENLLAQGSKPHLLDLLIVGTFFYLLSHRGGPVLK